MNIDKFPIEIKDKIILYIGLIKITINLQRL